MAKISSPARSVKRCLFCPNTDLSKTHIWPNWLNKLLSPGSSRLNEYEDPIHVIGNETKIQRRANSKQGSIFTQKPYLTCAACNGGWMNTFEDGMIRFSKPIFTSSVSVSLSNEHVRVISGWITLITVLAEYTDTSGNSITISPRDREYLKKHLKPPDHWTIIAASSNSPKWNARYRHHPIFVGQFASLVEYHAAVLGGSKMNSQISSFGMGRLFVQVFTCPNTALVDGFRISAKKSGFVQLWPPKRLVLPFRKTVKFPTDIILNNSEADEVADAFKKEINARTMTPAKA